MSKQTSKKSSQPVRYDVHRTLSSYGEKSAHTTKGHPKTSTQSVTPVGEAEKSSRFKITPVKVVVTTLLIPLLFLAIIGIWDYRNFAPASQKMFGSSNPFGLIPGELQQTEGATNIMLIGYSADDPGHAGAKLTDSIMIISLNKDKKTGYTLNIPRDLYVKIPDYGSAKINEAYQAGEQQSFSESGYAPGGVGMLQKIIKDDFGVTTHYYAVVNYGAVRELVTAVEGIDVTIDSSDPRGIYDPNFKQEEGGPLQLANGIQHIDGPTALRLTRARGATYGSYGFPQSDFNRTANQQKVFAALKQKITVSRIIDPRINKPLFDAGANNLTTNLTLSELVPLLQALRSVPDGQLKPIVLRAENGNNYLNGYQTPAGQSALVPRAGIYDYSEIKSLIKENQQ